MSERVTSPAQGGLVAPSNRSTGAATLTARPQRSTFDSARASRSIVAETMARTSYALGAALSSSNCSAVRPMISVKKLNITRPGFPSDIKAVTRSIDSVGGPGGS
ncbi:MAG: hypothetical protein M3083_22935 [Actinomycetota bacterium]|nr:hypothetical protein [Actinomycetota bacterium]